MQVVSAVTPPQEDRVSAGTLRRRSRRYDKRMNTIALAQGRGERRWAFYGRRPWVR